MILIFAFKQQTPPNYGIMHSFRQDCAIVKMLDRVREQRETVRRLVENHLGREVYVFGSCARGIETPKSDIDFLVDFKPGATLFGMSDLQDALGGLFGRSVDIVSMGALKDDSFGRRVRSEMIPV